MLPHKIQQKFCVFENWRFPQYPSLLENWGVILHLLFKSKREFKLGSLTYFKKIYMERTHLKIESFKFSLYSW
jgi:phosphatidate phosphatase APP1